MATPSWYAGLNASFQNLTQGDIFGAVIGSYTNVLGMWFYALVMFILMTMMYIKTQNFGTVVLTGMIISAAAIPFMPTETLSLISIMAALGVALILYAAFHKG